MGLNVPYLSTEWFERVRFVVDKAKEIGIDAWVYDEMDWPSGTADKQVLEANPDLASVIWSSSHCTLMVRSSRFSKRTTIAT